MVQCSVERGDGVVVKERKQRAPPLLTQRIKVRGSRQRVCEMLLSGVPCWARGSAWAWTCASRNNAAVVQVGSFRVVGEESNHSHICLRAKPLLVVGCMQNTPAAPSVALGHPELAGRAVSGSPTSRDCVTRAMLDDST